MFKALSLQGLPTQYEGHEMQKLKTVHRYDRPWIGSRWSCLLVLAASVLSGCGSVSKGIEEDGRSAQQLVWPRPDQTSALAERGSYVSFATLEMLHPGLDKQQINRLIGAPHFGEGLVGVREWNYVFRLPAVGERLDEQQSVRTCQLKVLFDQQDVAGSLYWLPEGCGRPQRAEAPLTVEPPPTVYTLGAEALFGFDRNSLDHISREGRDELKTVLTALSGPAAERVDVEVIGYADRLGSAAHNLLLSQQRAQAVRDYLVAGGVNPKRIRTQGLGSAQPVSQCDASQLTRPALIACLAPDRRVEVRVSRATN